MQKIYEVYIFVSADDDEQILMAENADGELFPLIAPDAEMMQALMPFAQDRANELKTDVRILHLHGRQEIGRLSASVDTYRISEQPAPKEQARDA